MATRVVVTGIGLVTSVGNDTESTWQALLAGKSGIRHIEHFDLAGQTVTIAGEVRDFDATPYMPRKEQRRNDQVTHFAVAASQMALAQAGLDVRAHGDDVGVIIGTGVGGLDTEHDQFRVLFEKGPDRISPFFISMDIADGPAGVVSIMTGAGGPNYCTVSACATSANAIGESYETIRRGDAKAMIAGGAEHAITPIGIASFNNMHALSRRNDDPTRASRPFDRERDGFVMGEGAGILILEDLEFAQARGATILGEVVGYGSTADAYHITEPIPNGTGLQRAMRRAVEKAGAKLTDVDYINAHGTSTPFNDRTETAAIKQLFGEHAYKMAISSTKSMIGHTLGAAGGIEAAVTLLSLQKGQLTPTINQEHPDPECDLDYVPNEARNATIRLALSNSMGFGGHNVSLAFRKWEG
ncbi:MAG: beta-ketoacyl-ACP synthase II [Ktedonobacterales bacterium]|nr:beta-ketoacyl-ACP synthase II [Ktedonobacterales bacterium]